MRSFIFFVIKLRQSINSNKSASLQNFAAIFCKEDCLKVYSLKLLVVFQESEFNEKCSYRTRVNIQELVTLKEERRHIERELERWKEQVQIEQQKYRKLLDKVNFFRVFPHTIIIPHTIIFFYDHLSLRFHIRASILSRFKNKKPIFKGDTMLNRSTKFASKIKS